MTTESVKVLIEAEDQASAKVEKAAQNVEASIKRVKTVGGQAKASTEFIGTLANSLGSSQLGGFAGELAQLTERISAFSEVSAAGGVGAMAFKAGLVAATAITSFKVGEAIGNWVFETERWKNELAAAGEEAAKLAAKAQGFQEKRFSEKREDINLIRDPNERKKAALEEAKRLDQQASDLESFRLKEAKKQYDDRQKFLEGAGRFNANQQELQKQTAAEIEGIKATRDALREEAKAYRESVGERQAMIEAQRQENAARDKQDAFLEGLREEVKLLKATAEEKRAIEAAKNTVEADPEARGEAEALLAERDALLAKQEAEKLAEQEREQARKKEEAEAERIASLQQRETERLEERRIAIEQGTEAAKAYALQQQGLDEAAAKSLAAKEEQLRKVEEDKEKQKQLSTFQSGTQATQGRLLTRGPAERGIDKIANATEKANVLLTDIKTVLQNQPAGNNSNANQIVMVGP